MANELQRLSKLDIDLQQNRLKLALDSAQAGLWEWNVITNENFWSDKLWELYGLDPATCKPSYEAWLSSINPKDQITVEQAINNAVKNGTPLNLEWRVARLFEGKERWLMAYGQPGLNERGELRMYRGIVIDISERKAMQIQLQDNEELLNFAMETIKAGVWILSLEDNTAKRTLQHDQIFGYDSLLPEWTFDKALDYILPEDRQAIEVDFSKARANLTDWSFECRIRRVDGEVRWIAGKAAHKFDTSGKPIALIGIIQDITERKEAEAKQRFEEIRYKAFVDQAAPDAMFVHDHNGDFIEVNRQACQSTGYTKDELLSMNVLDLEQDFNLACAQAEWSGSNPGETKTIHGRHRHKNGHQFPVEINFGLLVFEGRRLYLALVRDVTERNRMAQALQEKERLLADSQAVAHIGSWMVDLKTTQLSWSEEVFRLYGLSPETDDTPDWEQFLNLLHPDDRAAMQAWCDECSAGKQPQELEFRTHLINGQHRWLRRIGHLDRGADGEPWRIIGTVQDITKHKLIAEALRDSEARLKSFLDNSQVIAWLKDSKGRHVYLSANFEKRIGVQLNDWLGKTDFEVWPLKVAQQFYDNDQKVLSNHEAIEVVEETKNADGSSSWWLSCKFPFQDSQGNWFVGGLAVDISERKLTLDRLEVALNEKEVLLKEVYHRVKNNLQIISSLINLQAKSIINAETLIQLKQTADRVKAMALIHEKLYQSDDLAKIEFNEYIRSLLDHLLFSFGEQASHIKINTQIDNVLLNVDTAIPCGLIINELVSNALKHAFPNGQPGAINITFTETQGELILVIEDNGIGFPIELDFKKGNSLGLQLVTQLAAQLMGQISLDKQPGTKFTLRFNNNFPE